MGDVDFQVFVRFGFAGIAIQVEWFPLGRERGFGDESVNGWRPLGW